jgi:CRISPR system Cascade subunit CasC
MSTFLQLHLLTSYPPANLNRDDMGRPKTAKMGGVDRLRISSQSLKRAWRTSDIFQSAMKGHIGTRTKELGLRIHAKMIEGNKIKAEDARKWARMIAGTFGKLKDSDKKDKAKLVDLEIEQLAHISPQEMASVDALVSSIVREPREPNADELALLQKPETAVDIALFGRMLTKNARDESLVDYSQGAACQVSHAISVHPVVIEDDYFTAVDDLNDGSEDRGSAHIGERGFAAALFYTYICINRDSLKENLGGNEDLTQKALAALTETVAKVTPEGMQNSYGSRAYATYVLAEKGTMQPRSLSVAFLKPVTGMDYHSEASKRLEAIYQSMDVAYGQCAEKRYSFDVFALELAADKKPEAKVAIKNKMQELIEFVAR